MLSRNVIYPLIFYLIYSCKLLFYMMRSRRSRVFELKWIVRIFLHLRRAWKYVASEVLKFKCDWIKCNDNSVQGTFPSRECDCHVGKKRINVWCRACSRKQCLGAFSRTIKCFYNTLLCSRSLLWVAARYAVPRVLRPLFTALSSGRFTARDSGRRRRNAPGVDVYPSLLLTLLFHLLVKIFGNAPWNRKTVLCKQKWEVYVEN